MGGLIIGDAAIRAGMTSPSLLVVIATTAVATFTLVNQSLAGAVSILRIGILVVSSILGLFGFILSVFVILVCLANLRSFGVPYMTPLNALNLQEIKDTVVRAPWWYMKNRPRFLGIMNRIRQSPKKF